MTRPASPLGLARETLLGGLSILTADGLYVPTSLVIAAFLARRLGPADYGLFVLATTIATWIEWTLASLFARASIRQVAAASDWRTPAATLLRASLTVGLATGAVMWLLAAPIAHVMGEDALRGVLRVAAFNAPCFALALAHRFVLTGVGRFGARAVASAARSTGRLVLVLILVWAGWGVRGAVAATIAAWAIELAVARWFVRPRLTAPSGLAWRELVQLAAPLFAAGISSRLFERMGLFCLQALCGRPADTGTYGAAQSLATLPSLITTAFAPVLLSIVTRLLTAGQAEDARRVASQALRCVLWLAPVAAAIAGAAPDVVRVVFGNNFPGAAPILAILCIASLANVVLALTSTLLAAFNRAALALIVTAPLVPLALVGYLQVIPQFGGVGAAVVTSAVAVLVACLAIVTVRRGTGATTGFATWVRTGLIAAVAYVLAAHLPGHGLMVVPKLLGVGTLALLGLVATGEVAFADVVAIVRGARGRDDRVELPL